MGIGSSVILIILSGCAHGQSQAIFLVGALSPMADIAATEPLMGGPALPLAFGIFFAQKLGFGFQKLAFLFGFQSLELCRFHNTLLIGILL